MHLPAPQECASERGEYVACLMTPYVPCNEIVERYLRCKRDSGGK